MNEEKLEVISENGLLSNDNDPESEELTLLIITDPRNGEVDVSQDGSFTYTHDGSNTTSDSFVYSLTDQLERSITGTVYLTIFPFDDVPIILDDQKLSIDENSSNGSIVGSVSYDDEIYFRDSDLTGTFNLKVEDIVCGLNTSSNNSQDYKNGLNSIEGKIVISKDSEDKYKIKTIVNDTINLDGDWSLDQIAYAMI